MLKYYKSYRFIRFLSLIVIIIILTVNFCGCSKEPEPVGSENQRQSKKTLEITSKDWISWRYFNTRTMFYFSHLQSNRCGIKSAVWGLSIDKLDNTFSIGQCDEEKPHSVPSSLETYIYTDEISESDSDSFIGAGEENHLKGIFVQLTYFDESKSPVIEFPVPKSILDKQ